MLRRGRVREASLGENPSGRNVRHCESLAPIGFARTCFSRLSRKEGLAFFPSYMGYHLYVQCCFDFQYASHTYLASQHTWQPLSTPPVPSWETCMADPPLFANRQ